jgi:hypothetical protein
VNFKRDHFERASLYQAADYRGRVHSVMIPDVCGNVSVLGAEDQIGPRSPSESTLGDEDQVNPGAKPGSGSAAASGRNNVVSEPPTWAAVGVGLLLAAVATFRRGRRKTDD